MKIIKVVLNQAGQTDAETLSDIYALIKNPAFRTPNTIKVTFRHALKCLRDWKCQIYECETLGGLLIFSTSAQLLENYKVQNRHCQ